MSANISADGLYRYDLVRHNGNHNMTTPCVFIMLNPSTADAEKDDATIRRCRGFAESWGYGKLVVLNLFAFRATKPDDLKNADDPVGPMTDEFLHRYLGYAIKWKGPLVCAWGTHGTFRGRNKEVLDMITAMGGEPLALRVTKGGHPSHPLYLPKNLKPTLYTERPLAYSNRIKIK